MSVVLVIEPDSSQATVLRRVIKRVGAELVLVASTDAAVDAINRRIPDLLLLSALLAPRDEDRFIAHLRSLEGTSHLQTLTIPQFHSEQKSAGRKGSFGFRKKQESAPTGCDPALFAEEIVAQLARAAEERSHPPVPASVRFAKPAPLELVPALDVVAQADPEALLEMPGLMRFDSVAEPVNRGVGSGLSRTPPAGRTPPAESIEPDAIISAVEREAIISSIKAEASLVESPVIEPEGPGIESAAVVPSGLRGISRSEPSAVVDDEIERLAHELGLNVSAVEVEETGASAANASSDETSAYVIAEIARIQAEAQIEAETKIAAEVERVRIDAEAWRLAEIARMQAEADAIREAAIAEARAAAELEARETLAAEMARVRSEAESTFAEALNKVKVEAEQTLGVEIGRAREDVEALMRLRTEAQEAFAAELARVRSNAEQTLSVQLDTARAEAERVRAAEGEIARVRAEAEAEAERVRAAEAEVARVRAESDARLKVELARAREEADRASWVEKTKAKQATQQIKEEAALQARAVAQAEARRTLGAEIARVKAEADAVLEGEMARARAEAEARQAAQLQKLHAQMAEMRASAAQQARAATAEAVLAEVARASSHSKLTIVRNEPNVIQFRPVAAPPPVAVERPHIDQRVVEEALSRVAQEALSHREALSNLSNKDESIEVESDPVPFVQRAAQAAGGGDYYSLWQATSSAAPAEQQPEKNRLSPLSRLKLPLSKLNQLPLAKLGRQGAKWAIPVAACLLLVTNLGMVVSTVSWLVGSSKSEQPKKDIVLADTSPELFVSPVEPKTGELVVESTPAGAEVMLDGRSHGQTPLTIRKLKPGTYRMVLRSDAGTIARSITVEAGETAMTSEAIFAGWLAIFSPIPLEIFLDGRPVRPTDEGRIMTRPGKYQVAMVSEQFKYRTTEPLEVRPGEVTAHTVSLPMGTVHLTVPDGTEIRLEGEVVGRTPLDDLSIAIGTHEITATHPELGDRRVMVDVRHGEIADVKLYSE